VNSSQSMVASYRYDPYGNTISSSGTLASANLYRFSSKEVDPNYTDSGLYYYGYRWYDPNLQRWPNSDPLRDEGSLVYFVGAIEPHSEPPSDREIAITVDAFKNPLDVFTRVNANLSRFVANNPLANIDPRGLDWLDCMGKCIDQNDPINKLTDHKEPYQTGAKVCLTGLGGTYPYHGKPGTPLTTIPSRLSLGKGTARAGKNFGRIVGRIFSPIWVTYGLYLAGVEAMYAGRCTGDPDYCTH